jgi:hypothetical protein
MREAVRRALARDDLIMMATDADTAVGIVRQREALARRSRDEKSLFSVAFEHYLKAARNETTTDQPTTRARAWRHAGVIVRFGAMVDDPVTMPGTQTWTAGELHERSLRALDDDEPGGDPVDLPTYAFHLYRAAREHRLGGAYQAALRLSLVSDDALNGTGAAPHMAHLMYEAGAAHLSQDQPAEAEKALAEKDAYFAEGSPASFPTRYRFDFIRALIAWEAGREEAGSLLRTTLQRARRAKESRDAGHEDQPKPDGELALLSVVLTTAEHLAVHGASEQDHTDAVDLGREALRLADGVRGRWRVIARSRAPLAVVFQRIYGDIALLAAGLSTGPVAAEAAKVGLRVALSAKQTGFAARMRTGHTLMSPDVARVIQDIIRVEAGPRTSLPVDRATEQDLERLRFELQEAVSPMLADTVLPPPTRLEALTDVIGSRYALDYVQLRDSLNEAHLFRSLIRPGHRFSFERFVPAEYYARFFTAAGAEGGNLADMLDQVPADTRDTRRTSPRAGAAAPDRFNWADLADEVLPAAVRADLSTTHPARPIELVISAHSWLSLVPWPALRVGTDRLVERAIITQTPALTCLHHARPPRVGGRALVRLVGDDSDGPGLDVSAERAAWGLPPGNASVPFSACDVASDAAPRPLGLLDDALARWGFVHFAAHGAGRGLTQHLEFPGEEAVSFRHALTLRWPGSVLMASCHVGLVLNVTEAEPLNLVMGLLSGGARCVVAGIASVGDRGTGEAAGRIVRAIREHPQSLDVALRDAQLAAVDQPERQWALLAAYTQ